MANMVQYKDKLTFGKVDMFKRYGDSYKVPAYQTRRTAAMPDSVYAAAKKKDRHYNQNLIEGSNGLQNLDAALVFPIERRGSGLEPHHMLPERQFPQGHHPCHATNQWQRHPDHLQTPIHLPSPVQGLHSLPKPTT